jgi:uncharacterized membrane protein
MLLLSIHPIAQLAAIAVGVYAAYLGIQRSMSLHFGKATRFQRERHVIAGSIALISMLGGIAAGLIMVSRFMENPNMGLHEIIAKVLLPFLVFGIFSGFYLYLNPGKGKTLSAVHAINNLIIVHLAVLQIITGAWVYKTYVLGW